MCLLEHLRVFLGVAGRVLVCYHASAEYRYHVSFATIFTMLLCRSLVTTWIICLHLSPKYVRMLDSVIALSAGTAEAGCQSMQRQLSSIHAEEERRRRQLDSLFAELHHRRAHARSAVDTRVLDVMDMYGCSLCPHPPPLLSMPHPRLICR